MRNGHWELYEELKAMRWGWEQKRLMEKRIGAGIGSGRKPGI